jgi:hypothetical protein
MIVTSLSTDELITHIQNDNNATERELELVSRVIAMIDELDSVVEEIRKKQGQQLKDSTHGAHP